MSAEWKCPGSIQPTDLAAPCESGQKEGSVVGRPKQRTGMRGSQYMASRSADSLSDDGIRSECSAFVMRAESELSIIEARSPCLRRKASRFDCPFSPAHPAIDRTLSNSGLELILFDVFFLKPREDGRHDVFDWIVLAHIFEFLPRTCLQGCRWWSWPEPCSSIGPNAAPTAPLAPLPFLSLSS